MDTYRDVSVSIQIHTRAEDADFPLQHLVFWPNLLDQCQFSDRSRTSFTLGIGCDSHVCGASAHVRMVLQ